MNYDVFEKYKGYTYSYVAFLDILGFKQYVLTNGFDYVNDLFHDIRHFADLVLKHSDNFFTREKLNKVTFNIISDSIVLSIPKDADQSLEILLLTINTIIFHVFREYGLTIRGGISEGYFYSNNGLAFGPALVSAYNLENNVAVYPRVIFTRSLYTSYCNSHSKEDIKNLTDIMSLDIDDELFIADYFGYALRRVACDVVNGIIPQIYAEKLFKHIVSIIEDELATKTDIRIREKYIYFRDYYNNALSSLKSHYQLPFDCNFVFGRDKNRHL